MSNEGACSVFEIVDFQYLNRAHSCYFQLTWWMFKLKLKIWTDTIMSSKEKVLEIVNVINEVTYYKCYIWVHQLITAEVIHNNIAYGKTVTSELFACRGKCEMPLGSRNKPKSFTVLLEGAGLDSNSIRCNMQQNLYLLWGTYTNLIWEGLSYKGNFNPAYWFAALQMQSFCCMCSLSLKDKMIIANLRKHQRFNIEKTKHWHWGSNSVYLCLSLLAILFRESFLLFFLLSWPYE